MCPAVLLHLLCGEHDLPATTPVPGPARTLLAVMRGRRRCGLTALGSLRCRGALRDMAHLHMAQQRHWNWVFEKNLRGGTGSLRKTCGGERKM